MAVRGGELYPNKRVEIMSLSQWRECVDLKGNGRRNHGDEEEPDGEVRTLRAQRVAGAWGTPAAGPCAPRGRANTAVCSPSAHVRVHASLKRDCFCTISKTSERKGSDEWRVTQQLCGCERDPTRSLVPQVAHKTPPSISSPGKFPGRAQPWPTQPARPAEGRPQPLSAAARSGVGDRAPQMHPRTEAAD